VGGNVGVTPGSSRFDAGHPGWQDQVAALYALLDQETSAVSVRSAPRPGAKGTADTVILALGSSGALTAAVACFRAWLSRDKSRTLTLSWTDGQGAERRVTLAGDNIDQATLSSLAESIGERLQND
jgi:hypothetical protein